MLSLIIGSLSAFAATGNLTVFGTSYSGDYTTDGGISSAMAPAMGVDSLRFAEYTFTDTMWSNVKTKIAQSVAAPPSGSSVVWAAFYTADANPGTSLSLTNAAGVAYVYRTSGGDLHHRLFVRNATQTGYAENTSFRDQLTGGLGCDTLTIEQMFILGSLPSNSTVYVLSSTSTPSYMPGYNIDPDVGVNAIVNLPPLTKAMTDVLRTEPADDASIDDPWTNGVVANCAGGTFGSSCDNQESIEQCDAFRKVCGDPPGTCPAAMLAADQEYASNIELLHDFRDRLWAYPSLNKYVVAYALYGVYEGMSNSTALVQAMPQIEQAAYRVLHGGPNQVIVTSPLKTKMTAIINHARGKSTPLDVLLDDLQDKLDATVGMTRSQFCTYMVSDSDCTP